MTMKNNWDYEQLRQIIYFHLLNRMLFEEFVDTLSVAGMLVQMIRTKDLILYTHLILSYDCVSYFVS